VQSPRAAAEVFSATRNRAWLMGCSGVPAVRTTPLHHDGEVGWFGSPQPLFVSSSNPKALPGLHSSPPDPWAMEGDRKELQLSEDEKRSFKARTQ